jgi:hypothetical protein
MFVKSGPVIRDDCCRSALVCGNLKRPQFIMHVMKGHRLDQPCDWAEICSGLGLPRHVSTLSTYNTRNSCCHQCKRAPCEGTLDTADVSKTEFCYHLYHRELVVSPFWLPSTGRRVLDNDDEEEEEEEEEEEPAAPPVETEEAKAVAAAPVSTEAEPMEEYEDEDEGDDEAARRALMGADDSDED